MERTGLERVDAMKAYLRETPDGMILDAIVERCLGIIWTEFAKAVDAIYKGHSFRQSKRMQQGVLYASFQVGRVH